MSKVLVIILNVVRGLFLAASVGAAAAAAVEGGNSDDGPLFLIVAVTGGLAAVALAPRLWTLDTAVPASGPAVAPSAPEPAAPPIEAYPPSTPSQQSPAAPGQYPPASQPGQQHPPATTAQPVAAPPGTGQVYGGGTYQGQVYGQSAAEPPQRQPSPPPEWQQHR